MCQEPPIFGRCWWFLTRNLSDGGILVIMDRHDMGFLACWPKFSTSMIWSMSRNPSLNSILGGCWWFPTEDLEDGVTVDFIDQHDMLYLTCVPNFSYLAWLEVCLEPQSLNSILGGYWWFLTEDLEDGVILDIHGSSWYVILDLFAKIQLSSMIRSVSRTLSPWRPYLEDVKGFWVGLGGWGHPLKFWNPQKLL